ncbi:hypothetical protein Lfu02_30090 [Longispora fulva]|nr:hypothetical protein Lfu02_30090 [Longispora fulva]
MLRRRGEYGVEIPDRRLVVPGEVLPEPGLVVAVHRAEPVRDLLAPQHPGDQRGRGHEVERLRLAGRRGADDAHHPALLVDHGPAAHSAGGGGADLVERDAGDRAAVADPAVLGARLQRGVTDPVGGTGEADGEDRRTDRQVAAVDHLQSRQPAALDLQHGDVALAVRQDVHDLGGQLVVDGPAVDPHPAVHDDLPADRAVLRRPLGHGVVEQGGDGLVGVRGPADGGQLLGDDPEQSAADAFRPGVHAVPGRDELAVCVHPEPGARAHDPIPVAAAEHLTRPGVPDPRVPADLHDHDGRPGDGGGPLLGTGRRGGGRHRTPEHEQASQRDQGQGTPHP